MTSGKIFRASPGSDGWATGPNTLHCRGRAGRRLPGGVAAQDLVGPFALALRRRHDPFYSPPEVVSLRTNIWLPPDSVISPSRCRRRAHRRRLSLRQPHQLPVSPSSRGSIQCSAARRPQRHLSPRRKAKVSISRLSVRQHLLGRRLKSLRCTACPACVAQQVLSLSWCRRAPTSSVARRATT